MKHQIALVASLLGSTSLHAAPADGARARRQAAQEIYWSVGDDPISMDPSKQVDVWESGTWLGHLYEGLLRYDRNGALGPGAATSYDVSPDRKTWTFHLRPSAKWHDGKPVTAQDFEYTFKRLVDPAYASVYSFIATTAGIVNAAAVIQKQQTKEALGVKALDDLTLEIRLDHPVVFFPSLMAFQTFYPVRRDLVEKYGEQFAVDPASIVGNGPFRLTRWQKGASMRLEKAETYWDAAAIRITAIESPAMVKDAQADYNNFVTGGIDFVPTNSPEILRQAQTAQLKVLPFNSGCVNYLALNTRAGRPFASQDLRLAVQAGINRTELVNRIVAIPGYKPAFAFVPDYLPGARAGSTYRKEAPLTWKDADLPAATRHVAAFKAASGKTQAPPVTILAGDSSRAKKYAEYFQNTLARILGTEVRIENLNSKVQAQRTRDFDYDVSVSGWCPDYNDPMTYMDFYTAKNENNTTGWSNPAFDALIEQAAATPDPAQRVALFAKAEQIYLAAAPSVPYYQSGGAYVVAPGLSGIKRNAIGVDPDFRFAEWAKPVGH